MELVGGDFRICGSDLGARRDGVVVIWWRGLIDGSVEVVIGGVGGR